MSYEHWRYVLRVRALLAGDVNGTIPAANLKKHDSDSCMNKMRYSLAYGSGQLSVDVDAFGNTHEVAPKSAIAVPNLDSEVVAALERPSGADPPTESLSDSSTIALVVDESSRMCPARALLESALSYLRAYGFGPPNVVIFAAHRVGSVHQESEINRQLGDPISRGYTLVIHNPDDLDSVSNIGETSTFHTPLEVNRFLLQAHYRIGLGAIMPDPFVGATGGGMSVIPGVSGRKTILRNMKLRVSPECGPLDTSCPASVDILEASCLAGLDFVLNTVPDWKGSVARVVGGDPSAAWHEGVKTSSVLSSTTISRLADVVLVSAGGDPFDRTLYDAVDCLHAALQCSRLNGAIVLVAECAQGIGPIGFKKSLLATKSEKDVTVTAKKQFEIGMEKSRLFRRVTDTRRLVICSKLRESFLEEGLACGLTGNLAEALETAGHDTGSRSNMTLLPKGVATVIRGI